MNARHVQYLALAMIFGGLAGIGAAAGIQLASNVMAGAIHCVALPGESPPCQQAFAYLNTVFLVLLGAGGSSALAGAIGLRYGAPEAA